MAQQALGFISQLTDGTWTALRETRAQAEALVKEMGLRARRGYVALPVTVDLPETLPRPAVVTADGSRVVYRPGAKAYRVGTTDYPTLVALVRALAVSDADLDALQALPGLTAEWVQDGGRE